jgi:hypothetical protein
MRRSIFSRAGIATLCMFAVGCRSRPQSWPSEEADLVGQVLEVRRGAALPGFEVFVGPAAGGGMDRLRVRVIASRNTTPGVDAYVGVDGITRVARTDARGAGEDHPHLEGAFVRIWFRGTPRKSTPNELVAMARVVAIDSVGAPSASQ